MTDPAVSAAAFDAVLDQLDAGAVPDKQIFHVLFRDLVSDPVSTVAELYRHFDLELTDDGLGAMAQYMLENPRDNRPQHTFDTGSAAAVAAARKAFARYQTRFGVPSE